MFLFVCFGYLLQFKVTAVVASFGFSWFLEWVNELYWLRFRNVICFCVRMYWKGKRKYIKYWTKKEKKRYKQVLRLHEKFVFQKFSYNSSFLKDFLCCRKFCVKICLKYIIPIHNWPKTNLIFKNFWNLPRSISSSHNSNSSLQHQLLL